MKQALIKLFIRTVNLIFKSNLFYLYSDDNFKELRYKHKTEVGNG